MGLFDLGRDRGSAEKSRNAAFERFINGEKSEPVQKGPLTVFHPQSFEDVENAIDTLKRENQVLVHLGELTAETGCHVIDMLSGAVYALGGGIYEIEPNVFICTTGALKVKK